MRLFAAANRASIASRHGNQGAHLPFCFKAAKRRFVTEDELMQRFDLARQAIAAWSGEAAGLVRAAALARETGQADAQAIAAARRMLEAVQTETRALSDAAHRVDAKSDELTRGLATAFAELNALERHVSDALALLQGAG
jgi:hypothetical protein